VLRRWYTALGSHRLLYNTIIKPKRVGFVTPDDSDSDYENGVSEKEDA
jgi:hypothetical protein